MKIMVLIKQVPDTWGSRNLDPSTGWLDRTSGDQVLDEINERALEAAISAAEAVGSSEIIAVMMGPDNVKESIKKALAMGCTSAIHILDDSLAGADAALTSKALAATISREQPDLVVAGNESTDGRGGVVPAMVAERLAMPHLGNLSDITISDTYVSGERRSEKTTQRVEATLPAVISVNESNPDGRFPSFKGILAAKKKPVTVLSLEDLSLESGSPLSTVKSTTERPPREQGTIVPDSDTAVPQLLDFLSSNKVI
jgi:electron transfer flavoprotein beta subunit